MDPLSELLTLIKPRDFGFRGIDAGSDWGLQYPSLPGMKVFSIRAGECCAQVEEGEPINLASGQILVVSSKVGFRLSSHLHAKPIAALPFLNSISPGAIGTLDGGGRCFGVGGYFSMTDDLLLPMWLGLPDTVLFEPSRETRLLDELIDRILEELREPRPGGRLFADHLAQCVMIATMRAVSSDTVSGRPGLLRGMKDSKVDAAITAIHDEPGRSWTLSDLASTASMSRTAFAIRFRDTVGLTPFAYLTRWRITCAADRLRKERVTIAQLCYELGYASESAFSAAFRRTIGISPRRFADQAISIKKRISQ